MPDCLSMARPQHQWSRVLTVNEADNLASPATDTSQALAERRASTAQLRAGRGGNARKALLRLAGGLLGLVGTRGSGLGSAGGSAALDERARLAQGEPGRDAGRHRVCERV